MDLPTSPKKLSYIQSKQRKQALIAAPKEISLEAKQIFKPCLDINNISLQEYRGFLVPFVFIHCHVGTDQEYSEIVTTNEDCHANEALLKNQRFANKTFGSALLLAGK